MSLSNLQAIGRLQAQPPDPPAMAKLLQAARQNLADARVEQISASNRFDASYKCIMQCAMLGLWVNGWRTSTSQPGHHQTAIQTLDQTLGVPKPDPKPMLHAAAGLKLPPEHCMYVGDAERDIEAGRVTGMRTVLADYGYIADSDTPDSWGADLRIAHPRQLLDYLPALAL